MTKQTGLAMLLLLAATTISLQASDTERWSREIIVKWREVPARLDGDRFPAEVRGQVVDVRAALPVGERTTVGLERISVVEVNNASTVPKFIALLQHDPQVEYVEPRALRYIDGWTEGGNRGREGALDGVPNDPFYGQQWGLVAMEAEAAWNITRGDPSVAIAVLDLGVDFTHPELVHCRWENAAERSGVAGVDDDGNGFVDDVYGWDFVEGDGEPWSQLLDGDEAHGTHVAGLAAAARNNGQGIAGLAPDCKIMGVRVGHHGQIPYGYDGIYYACRSGAKVINCSWGGEFESAYERDVVQYAAEMGCVIVASAGNSATSQEHYPAGIEGVLSVAATRIGDFAADFTQYGSWVKVSAPGVAMLSTFNTPGGGHSYGTWQGTSMSAPLVAATCALVKSRFPQMTGRHLMARVMGTADPIDGKNPTLEGQIGLGRVNAWRALADSAAGIRVVDDSLTETSGNGDGRIRAGETATLRLAIRNDGTGVGGMAAFLATSATDVGLRNPVLVFEDVPPGGPVWSESVVAIELAGTARRGFLLPLSIDFIGGNGRLAGRVTRTIYLDSTFVCLDNGRLRLGFAEDGSLGYYDREQDHYIGCGFRTA
ncbi:S8 family serine peptidase, partial [bacterium]|nr:S8 family serine peptidase [bacterium]